MDYERLPVILKRYSFIEKNESFTILFTANYEYSWDRINFRTTNDVGT